MKFYKPAVAVLLLRLGSTPVEGSSGKDMNYWMSIDTNMSRGSSLTTAEAVHSMTKVAPQDEAARSRNPYYHPLLQASREGVARLDAELTARMRSVDPDWIDWANDDRRADKRPSRREARKMAGSVLPEISGGVAISAVTGGSGGSAMGGITSTAPANLATEATCALTNFTALASVPGLPTVDGEGHGVQGKPVSFVRA